MFYERARDIAYRLEQNRARSKLRRFLLSVESGEYFHTHRRSFDPGQRFWTSTAALNDADELAATVLMRPTREGA